jgi:peptidoglycan-N-acetylglucosamine deacetylase
MFTNDVEEHSIWFNSLRYETGLKVLKEGMPLLLDIYDKYNIKSTFFFTGYMAMEFPEVVKITVARGHEIGSHGYSHEVDQAFDVLPYNKQVEHLRKSKLLLEELSGQEVISFRAPALRINRNTAGALAESGFKIDSSVASQRFDMFLSFGGIKKISWLTAPRLPYKTDENNLCKKGKGCITEVPLSAFLLPFTSTTMRVFPNLTNIQKHFVNMESSIHNKPVVFDIHPNEFINEFGEKRIIQRRSKNYINYLIRDHLRSMLKIKNMAKDAIPLYERLINYFLAKDYCFTSIKDYCEIRNLI